MSEKLQEIINNIVFIQRPFTESTMVTVKDTEKFLVQRLVNFDTLKIPVGTPIRVIDREKPVYFVCDY
jgi:hypothetical protein